MNDAAILRAQGEAADLLAAELDRDATVPEKVRDYLTLLETFAPFFERTEAAYRAEREALLAQIQERLRRAGETGLFDGSPS